MQVNAGGGADKIYGAELGRVGPAQTGRDSAPIIASGPGAPTDVKAMAATAKNMGKESILNEKTAAPIRQTFESFMAFVKLGGYHPSEFGKLAKPLHNLLLKNLAEHGVDPRDFSAHLPDK